MFDEGASPNCNANAIFYHCCIQMVDKKWPVPPLSSNLWMMCCVKPVKQVNAYHMHVCLTSVLVWPLHFISLTGVQVCA